MREELRERETTYGLGPLCVKEGNGCDRELSTRRERSQIMRLTDNDKLCGHEDSKKMEENLESRPARRPP